jgi:hypothetical protein
MTPEAVIEKLMVGVSPNLYWTCQRNKIEWKRLRRDQIGNPLTLSTFFPQNPPAIYSAIRLKFLLFRCYPVIFIIPLLGDIPSFLCNSVFQMAFPSLHNLHNL